MIRRIGAVIAATTAVWCVLAACACAEPAATVNGRPVDQQVLFEYMLKRHGSRSLLNLVAAEAIKQAAEKQGVKVTDADVDAAIAKKRETFDRTAIETGVDFEMVLFSQGDTLTTFRESERTLLLLKGLVAKDVKTTDEAVQEYYRTHLGEFKLREAMKVSLIRMDDLEKTTEVRKAIIAGEITFEAAAKQYSNDPYTKDSGGKVDRWIGRGNTPFLQAAYSLLNDKDTSDIVPFPGLGYYLVRRDQYVRDYQLDFDEVKDDIRELLGTQMIQNLAAAKQRELMKAADIKFQLTWPEGSFLPPKPAEAPKP
jgi:foldase protein PrsA